MLTFEIAPEYTFYMGHLFTIIVALFYALWVARRVAAKQYDKVMHAVVSSVLVVLGIIAFGVLWWISLPVALVLGFFKEFYDLFFGSKKFDWLDIMADGVGSVSIYLIYLFSFVMT